MCVSGLGGVLVFSPSYIAVSYWFDKKKGKAMALSTLGTGFGSIVMGPVIMALVSYYGYFGTMLITSALMLNNSVGGALYRRPPKNPILLQGVIVAGVNGGKTDVDLKNETETVAVDNDVFADGRLNNDATELRALSGEMTAENGHELSLFSEENAAKKIGNTYVENPAEKTTEEHAESAEGTGVESSGSGVNLEEMTGEKFSEVDQSAGHTSLENIEKSRLNESTASTESAEMFQAFDNRSPEHSRGTDNLGDPHPTKGSIDSPYPSVETCNAVDTKVPSTDSQLAFVPEDPAYKSTPSRDAETEKNCDVVRCLAHCPSMLRRLFSLFKSSLWINIPFILHCTMVAATQGCIQAVLIFLPGCGRELGATRQEASLLLTVFGAADMVGRFVFGFVFDLKPLRSRRTDLFTAVAASFAAMSILLGFMPSYLSLAVVTALVGFFQGGAHSQRATNVTELVEPSQMSIGVGLVIFFQGLGNFYGPLVGGGWSCFLLYCIVL